MDEPKPISFRVKATNEVTVEWEFRDGEPIERGYSYPAEWRDKRYRGSEVSKTDEEIAELVSEAFDETRPIVEEKFYA